MGSEMCIRDSFYMGSVEAKALNILTNSQIGFYSRYVDDACLLTKNAAEAEHIKSVFNNVDPNIKFEIEHPTAQNSLSLLDITIRINSNGDLYFDFFTKSAKKPIFVNSKCKICSPDQQ